jgi:hypothetical protein
MNALASLAPFARTWRPVARAGERCEMCAEPIDEHRHRHLVDLERRLILCACSGCGLGQAGAAGRYRTVPTRVLTDATFSLDDAQWNALQIPVRLAFIFFNSSLGRWVALYPSPAGAAESQLPLEAFAPVAAATPLVAAAEPDVEALLVYGRLGRPFQLFLAPIDVCYQLVGKVRVHWTGFHGGDRAWQEIESFFADLRTQSGAAA